MEVASAVSIPWDPTKATPPPLNRAVSPSHPQIDGTADNGQDDQDQDEQDDAFDEQEFDDDDDEEEDEEEDDDEGFDDQEEDGDDEGEIRQSESTLPTPMPSESQVG